MKSFHERGPAASLARLIGPACLLLLGAAPATWAATPVLPTELTVTTLNMTARLDNFAGLIAEDKQALLASVSQGASLAEADYANGTLKGVATAASAGVDFTLATAAFDFMATNTSAAPIKFTAGSMALDVEASFARALGAGPSGTVGNTLNAVFIIAILASDNTERFSGHGFYQYRYTIDIGDPGPDLVPMVLSDGGFTVDADEDADEAHALITSPALELLPGETLGLFINVTGSANVINLLGGAGFSATTDFGHTAQLSMQLPAGVSFITPTPNHWVSAVPEPQTWALWLVALAGFALRAKRR